MITNQIQNSQIIKPVIKNSQIAATKNFKKFENSLTPELIKIFKSDRDMNATSHKLAQQKNERLIDRFF